MHVKFSRVNENAKIPIKGSKQSAGFDLYAGEVGSVNAFSRKLVSTSLKLEHCSDYMYLRIAPRSSLAVKGIDVGAGVVDADYRGEVKVLIINTTREDFHYDLNTRIAQMIPTVISNHTECFILGEENSTNSQYIVEERGEGGFGSTN